MTNYTVRKGPSQQLTGAPLPAGSIIRNTDTTNGVWVGGDQTTGPTVGGVLLGPVATATWNDSKKLVWAALDTGNAAPVSVSIDDSIGQIDDPVQVGLAVAEQYTATGIPAAIALQVAQQIIAQAIPDSTAQKTAAQILTQGVPTSTATAINAAGVPVVAAAAQLVNTTLTNAAPNSAMLNVASYSTISVIALQGGNGTSVVVSQYDSSNNLVDRDTIWLSSSLVQPIYRIKLTATQVRFEGFGTAAWSISVNASASTRTQVERVNNDNDMSAGDHWTLAAQAIAAGGVAALTEDTAALGVQPYISGLAWIRVLLNGTTANTFSGALQIGYGPLAGVPLLESAEMPSNSLPVKSYQGQVVLPKAPYRLALKAYNTTASVGADVWLIPCE